jgi:WD40 repeat protein
MARMREIKIDRDLARWVALGAGVIALVVMAIAILIEPQNRLNTTSYIALGVAIVGVAAFVLLDPETLVKSVTGRSGQYAITTWLMSIFFVAFVIALYVIVRESKIDPWDLTASQKYQMSAQSVELIKTIPDEIHAVGFYSDAQSSDRKDAEIWLQKYSAVSNGKITYEFVDPDRNPGVATQYKMSRPGVIVFKKGEETAEASFADERDITGALLQLITGKKRIAYMVTGHGERKVDDFGNTGYSSAQGLLQSVNFDVQPLNLLEKKQVPDDANVVIIAGPTTQFSQTEVDALKAYLDKGGAALMMFEPGTSGGALGNGVLGVAFNSDGTRFATAGADGTAKVWDTTSGKELLTLRGHSSDVVDVKFSPDGTRIATASRDGSVIVWNANSGDQVAKLEGETAQVRHLAFSPDGSLIASVGENQVMNVWDANSLKPKSYSPVSTPTSLYSIVFSPDGTKIAAGGGSTATSGASQGVVYLWDAGDGKELVNKTLHTNIVLSVQFSADGASVLSVALDGTAGTLNASTGEGNTETLYPGVGITGLAIVSDTTRIYTLANGEIHIRTTGEGGTQDKLLSEHKDLVWAIALSPDGKTFVTGSRDGSARVWSTDSEKSLLQITGHSTQDQLAAYLNSAWGITVDDDIAVDLGTAQEFDELSPVIYSYGSSSITQALVDRQLRTVMITARSLTVSQSAPAGITLTPLAETSNLQAAPTSGGATQGSSWGETNPYAGIAFDEKDKPGPVTLGVSGENGTTKARLVVFGDTDFAGNDGLSRSTYGNNELFLNSVNWLTQNETLLNLPTTDFGTRVLDKPLDTAGLIISSIAATCLLPLAMLVAGAAVWITRRRKR